MSPKPTKTLNRLHLTDLDPIRFEDLCLALVYPWRPWLDIQHYGRLGGDGGVDIFAREPVEDGSERRWFIQCRRYSKATRSTLTKAVDDALAKAASAPDVLLLVLACDVTRATHEHYLKYAKAKKVATALLWSQSTIEARLHAERRDLLFTYFGISEAAQTRSREATVRRSVGMKKRVHRELLKDRLDDPQKLIANPSERFAYGDAIIHSIDDTSYPEVDDAGTGISGWFKLEVFDLYHNGIEFVLGIEYVVIDNQRRWAVVQYDQRYDEKKYQRVKVFHIGRIPYRNIVEIDTLGDEYYTQPHIYCRFADEGEPYEGFTYRVVGEDYPVELPPAKRFKLEVSMKPAGSS